MQRATTVTLIRGEAQMVDKDRKRGEREDVIQTDTSVLRVVPEVALVRQAVGEEMFWLAVVNVRIVPADPTFCEIEVSSLFEL